MATTIGSLLIRLGLESGAFKSGLSVAERELKKATRDFEKLGRSMQDLGGKLSLAVTAPIAAAGAYVVKSAGDFEAAMGRIGIATEASAGELKKMSDLALQLGKDTIFSASSAAEAMELLAKTGVETKDILGGAAKAVTDLAAATGSELDPAASAISDSMNQFKLTAKDLPTIVNQITGAVNESKFGFEDFQGGLAQAGGVAASAGVSFQDLAATLAATSSQFSSGSDAGTSLKTFLLALTPTTDKAAGLFQELGLNFYEANGQMKSMAEVAQILRDKFGGLSEEARNSTLKELFGTDAIRTAVGLMEQGAAGIDKISAKLAATDAGDQAAKRMAGFNGQLEQLKGSLETLAIKIGQSGMLEALTSLVTGAGNFVDKLSELNPEILKWATIVAGLVAVIGPLLIALGAIVGAIAPVLAALKTGAIVFGTFGTAIAAAVPLLGGLVVALAPVLVPLAALAAAVGAVYLAWKNWDAIKGFVAGVGQAVASFWNGTVKPVLAAAIGRVAAFAAAWGELRQKAIAAVSGLASGVKTWLVDKLNAVWGWVTDKIESVKRAFFNLYDAVVGHSYVPDMVDGIAQQMLRLDAVLVSPVERATNAVAQRFRELAQEVRPILDELFPEAARLRQFEDKRDILRQGVAAGIISPGVGAEAISRLSGKLLAASNDNTDRQFFGDAFDGAVQGINDLSAKVTEVTTKLGPLGEYLKDIGTKGSEAFENVAVRGLQSLEDGILDALTGAKSLGEAFRSVAQGIIQDLLRIAIRKAIVAPLANALFGSGSGGLLGGLIGGHAAGTLSAPRGLAWVGERGPELVQFRGGERVYNNRESMRWAGAQRGGDTFHFTVNVSGGRMSERERRETGTQIASAAQRRMAQARKSGLAG